jgi:cysteine dioxygenase
MKILQGGLKETLYACPNERLLRSGEDAPLEVKKETLMEENEVTYITSKQHWNL